MKRAMMINPADNVVVAADAISKGEEVYYDVNGERVVLTAATDVPVYHKLTIKDIAKGEKVVKYGCTIGVATADIPKGAHAHVQNFDSESLVR